MTTAGPEAEGVKPQVATPLEFNVVVQNVVPPELKMAVQVGVAPLPLTVAVSVTADPADAFDAAKVGGHVKVTSLSPRTRKGSPERWEQARCYFHAPVMGTWKRYIDPGGILKV